jgi:hypothetical protein
MKHTIDYIRPIVLNEPKNNNIRIADYKELYINLLINYSQQFYKNLELYIIYDSFITLQGSEGGVCKYEGDYITDYTHHFDNEEELINWLKSEIETPN